MNRPSSFKPSIPEVLPLARRYCSRRDGGGSLHIVLEDDNVDDASVRWCIDYAEERGDPEGRELARLLLLMSKTQRRKLARML